MVINFYKILNVITNNESNLKVSKKFIGNGVTVGANSRWILLQSNEDTQSD